MIINLQSFPIIKTKRLLLRELTFADENEIYFLRSNFKIIEHLNKEPAKDVNDARKFIQMISTNFQKKEALLWGICLKENTHSVLGTICLWNFRKEFDIAEIGFVLHYNYWNQGIMSESIEQVINYGFNTIELKSIDAIAEVENKASCRVLEKMNFNLQHQFQEKKYNDELVCCNKYSISKPIP